MIDEIVNYQIPDKYHSCEAGFFGHRDEEMKSIYTALYAKVLELSPQFRKTALYIHRDNPYLLEMFIETASGGMLIKMQEAIDFASMDGDKILEDCILMGKAPYVGNNYNPSREMDRLRQQYARDGRTIPYNRLITVGQPYDHAPNMLSDQRNFGRFHVGAYGFTLPAPSTESKFTPQIVVIGVPVLPLEEGKLEDLFPTLSELPICKGINLYRTIEQNTGRSTRRLPRTREYNIVTHSDRGLVYERDHGILEGFDVAVLYECDQLENVHAQFKRVVRRSPSGWLELHVRAESNKIRHGFRIKNGPSSLVQDSRPSRGKLTPIFTRGGDFTLSGKIDYKTWFELVRSKENARDCSRTETKRILGLAVHFSKRELSNWDREVIGLTNAGQIVFGYARVSSDTNNGNEYEYALLKMGCSAIFDSENLVALNTIVDSGSLPESATEPEVTSEPDLTENCGLGSGYRLNKWLTAGRNYCAERNQVLDETSIKIIFAAYVNSGAKVTEGDIKDFSRLTG